MNSQSPLSRTDPHYSSNVVDGEAEEVEEAVTDQHAPDEDGCLVFFSNCFRGISEIFTSRMDELNSSNATTQNPSAPAITAQGSFTDVDKEYQRIIKSQMDEIATLEKQLANSQCVIALLNNRVKSKQRGILKQGARLDQYREFYKFVYANHKSVCNQYLLSKSLNNKEL